MPTSKQRRDAQRRRLERRMRRRAQQEARRRRMLLLISVVGTLVVVAVVVGFVVMTGNDNSSSASKTSSTSPSASASPTASATSTAASYPCTWTQGGTAARKVTKPPTTTPSRKGTVQVSVTTTQGPMTFTLNRAQAPCTVASFVSLAEQHYFDRTACHRLTSGTLNVLQCGDPTATGRGGPGYTIPEELTGKETYNRGVIAMARTAATHSGGSQFFIVYKNSQLSPDYTVFGTVTKGLGVVDKVAAKGAPGGDGKPKLPITLTKVLVEN